MLVTIVLMGFLFFLPSLTGSTVPMILQNTPCEVVNNISCTYNRTFVPQTDETSLAEATNTNLAVFFDLLENVSSLPVSDTLTFCFAEGLSGFTDRSRQYNGQYDLDWLPKFSHTRCAFH